MTQVRPLHTRQESARSSGNGEMAGAALGDALLNRLWSVFGVDLSAVRVHHLDPASRLATQHGAKAVTVGTHVMFSPGAWDPDSADGFALLAHEATHVIQQAQRHDPTAPTTRRQLWNWEAQARRAERLVMNGHKVRVAPTDIGHTRSTLVQAHGSYEHRVLGDLQTTDLLAIAANTSNKGAVLKTQLGLLAAFQFDPDSVDEAKVASFSTSIRTMRLGPDKVLATYGEVNALPDYLANPAAIESLGHSVLMPVLQVIRQEGFNALTYLYTGSWPLPLVQFAHAACAPWRLSMVNNIVETGALDTLTTGLGRNGADHYQGLLSRNACHFAPYSWYRWQSAHLIARDLAFASHAATGDVKAQLTADAWAYAGYADHFLQDSFAAGHLINKTLVMQWFVEWVTNTVIPVGDWSWIQNMTTARQPGLSASGLYVAGYGGPSTDPQTVEELLTVSARTAGSQVVADGSTTVPAAYQNYLTLLSSAVAQLASATLHDYFNDNSAWVTSPAETTAYEVWGDYTLLTGSNGSAGVQATSQAAQLSKMSILDLMSSGGTNTSVKQIRDQFPTGAGLNPSNVTDLYSFNQALKPFAFNQFSSAWPQIKNFALRLLSPRLGVSSRDQNLGDSWSTNLSGTGYTLSEPLLVGQRLFAGSNGMIFELDAETGVILQTATINAAGGEVRLASDGASLYAGVMGAVRACPLGSLTTTSWTANTGQGAVPVSVLVIGGVVAASANGFLYTLAAATGQITQSTQLASSWWSGDYSAHLATDGQTLYVGTHGYVYARRLAALGTDVFSPVGIPSGTLTYNPVQVLWHNGWLYAGSNGYVQVIDPGGRVGQVLVTGSVGAGDYTTRLTCDGVNLYVGVHGWVYALPLSNPTITLWAQGALGGLTGAIFPVHVLAAGGRVLAGCNGFLYDLDSATGAIRSNILSASAIGVGSYETRLTSDGRHLYAGSHGYVYGTTLLAAAAPTPVDSLGVTVDRTGNRHAVCVDQKGTLLHRSQTSGQGWTPWADVCAYIVSEGHPDIRPVASVAASAFTGGDLQILAVDPAGRLWHTLFLPEGTGVWTPWLDVRAAVVSDGKPDIGPVSRVACSINRDDILMVLVVDAAGTPWLNLGDNDNNWQPWLNMRAGSPAPTGPDIGPVLQPAVATDGLGNLHLLVVDSGGRLWHRELPESGPWAGWEDVRTTIVSQGHPDVGFISTVSVSADPSTGNLNVVVTDSDDVAWYAERLNDQKGTWTPFGDVQETLVAQGSRSVGPLSMTAVATDPEGTLSLLGLDEGCTPWLTQRVVSGPWTAWSNLQPPTVG